MQGKRLSMEVNKDLFLDSEKVTINPRLYFWSLNSYMHTESRQFQGVYVWERERECQLFPHI